MRPIVLVDGRLCDGAGPAVSALDRGFTLGDGVFETMKGTEGTLWYLDRHLDRLVRDADVLGITLPPALRDWVAAAAREAFAGAGADLIRLRVTVSRGVAHVHTVAGHGVTDPTVVVVAAADAPVPEAVYARGIRVHVASKPRNERGYAAGIKATSYLEFLLGLREAADLGFDDALFLDTRGMVSETSHSNVFAVVGGELVTPALTCGPLPGITRAVVLELVRGLGLTAEEREFSLDEFLAASEAFTTSSLRGIVPLVGIDERNVGTGIPGPVTRRLMEAYAVATDRR